MCRDVDVDRIQVRVSSLEPLDARALAQAIAAGLAPTLGLAPGEAALERLAVSVEAKPNEPDGQRLAERAAAQIVARIGRGTSFGASR